jgi:hypothetical protein
VKTPFLLADVCCRRHVRLPPQRRRDRPCQDPLPRLPGPNHQHQSLPAQEACHQALGRQDLREDKEPVDYPRAISLVNRIKVCSVPTSLLPQSCIIPSHYLTYISLRADSSRRNVSTSHSSGSSISTAIKLYMTLAMCNSLLFCFE